jgi:hypothetical protein
MGICVMCVYSVLFWPPVQGALPTVYRIKKLKKRPRTKTKLHGLSPQANCTDRLSDRHLSAKLVPTLADRGCRVVSATIPPQSLILVFLDRSRYFLE